MEFSNVITIIILLVVILRLYIERAEYTSLKKTYNNRLKDLDMATDTLRTISRSKSKVCSKLAAEALESLPKDYLSPGIQPDKPWPRPEKLDTIGVN